MDRRNGCRLLLSALRSQWTAVAALVLTGPVAADAAQSVAAVESAFADFNDAQGAVSLIDSDPQRYSQFEAKSRAQWQQLYVARRAELVAELSRTAARMTVMARWSSRESAARCFPSAALRSARRATYNCCHSARDLRSNCG